MIGQTVKRQPMPDYTAGTGGGLGDFRGDVHVLSIPLSCRYRQEQDGKRKSRHNQTPAQNKDGKVLVIGGENTDCYGEDGKKSGRPPENEYRRMLPDS